MLVKEVKAGDGVVNVWWLILAQCNEEAGGKYVDLCRQNTHSLIQLNDILVSVFSLEI